MKFGCIDVSQLGQVAWGLPPDSPATRALLGRWAPGCRRPAFYLGCAVWADRSFVGRVYPPGTPAGGFLKAYCRQFNAVELNSTFYGFPTVAQVRKWRGAATPGFRFCPKVPRSITHCRQLAAQGAGLARFVEVVLHFGEALGVALMQLPPYCGPGDLGALQQLLGHVPAGFPLAVEVRHPGWFQEPAALGGLFAFLQTRGFVAVVTDVAGRRDVLHQTLTTGCAFVRFVGNGLHATDYARIDAWVRRLQGWLARGLPAVYFLLHQPEKVLCADLAVYMVQQLRAVAGLEVVPPKLLEGPPGLFPA